MPRGHKRGALPLAPDRGAGWPGGAARPEGPAVWQGRSHVASDGQWRAGWGDVGPVGSPLPPHLRHPRWLPAPRQLSRRHRRRVCPTGAVRRLRLRGLRGGRARRSSGPAAGKTAGPGPVPGRGRAGLGHRRGRRRVDRRAHRATSANPGGSARGGRGLRPAAQPPAPPYGRKSSRGSVPRLYAGRWPSTTSGSGPGCAA